jgi:DNA-binding response OmpR family regulator
VQEVLEAKGYQVITAANGTAARHLALGQRIDAAVIEVMLSDESGTVLGSDLAGAGLPVLMMTGHSDGVRLLDSLPLWRIHKPFRPDTLARRVEEIVSIAQIYPGMSGHEC